MWSSWLGIWLRVSYMDDIIHTKPRTRDGMVPSVSFFLLGHCAGKAGPSELEQYWLHLAREVKDCHHLEP